MSLTLTSEMLSSLDAKLVAKLQRLVSPDAAKPKKVLSPEHLAKMKAGREAKKSKDVEKKAEPVASATEAAAAHESVAAPVAPEAAPEAVAAPEAKKRGPKKLADMTPEELAAHKEKVEARKAKKAVAPESAAAPESVAAPEPEPQLSIVASPAVFTPLPDSPVAQAPVAPASPVVTPPVKKRGPKKL
jgi:hypothetical protein